MVRCLFLSFRMRWWYSELTPVTFNCPNLVSEFENCCFLGKIGKMIISFMLHTMVKIKVDEFDTCHFYWPNLASKFETFRVLRKIGEVTIYHVEYDNTQYGNTYYRINDSDTCHFYWSNHVSKFDSRLIRRRICKVTNSILHCVFVWLM